MAREIVVSAGLGVHFERLGRIWDRSVGERRTVLEDVDMCLNVGCSGIRRNMEECSAIWVARFGLIRFVDHFC